MNESFEQIQELAGEYVLGTLPLAARQQVERRLPHEPSLRAAVAEWERRLLPLTELAGEEPPSAQLWPRIARSLTPRAATGRTGWRRWWDDVRLWRGLAAGGFATAAVVGALVMPRLDQAPSAGPAYMVVLVAPQDKAPGYVVQTSLDRKLTLVPLNASAPPSQKAYQFWTKGSDWAGPKSLGLVKPGQALTLRLDRLPPVQPDQLFEITLEPATGSPIDRPTGPVLFIGKAVKVM